MPTDGPGATGLPLDPEALSALATARDATKQRSVPSMAWSDLVPALLISDSAASRMVETLESNADRLRAAAMFFAGAAVGVPAPDIETETVARARELAQEFGHTSVGTDHLLLALADTDAGSIGSILGSMGLDTAAGRDALRAARGELPDWRRPRGVVDRSPSQGGGMHGTYSFPVAMSAPLEFVTDVTPEFEELRQLMMEGIPFAEVGRDRLVRVVGIGQVQEHDRVTIELIALEVRERGSVLHWRLRSDHPAVGGTFDATVTDDLRTDYQAWQQGGSNSWGEDGSRADGEVVIVPALPTDARTMVITISAVRDAPWASRPGQTDVTGSWRFEIDL